MSEELAVLEQTGLAVVRPPDVVLEEAQRAAAALKRVIDAKPNKVMFGTEQYIEHEDWQTVGRFYGLAEQIIWTRPVELGSAAGWEARAEAIHVASGRVVASAEAMCLNDEEKWRARPKYEWHYALKGGGTQADDPGPGGIVWEDNPRNPGRKRPKKERVLVGEEAVPQFQLRSMAQTRAGAKALRNALGWVVVLAGYKPTPAEELDTRHEPQAPPRAAEPVDAETIEQEAQRLFPDEPVGGPGAEGPAELSESMRSVFLDRINHFRAKKKISDDVFAGICAKFRVTVPQLGTVRPATLQDILNAVIQHKA